MTTNPYKLNSFLPWPKCQLEELVPPDGDLTAYQAQWSRDWEYVNTHTNYDESKVGDLPIPSVLEDPDTGKRISSAAEWPALRAKHLANITRILYGELPPKPQSRRAEVILEKDALDGKATLRVVRLTLCNDGKEHPVDVLCHIPKSAKPVPAIVAMNFQGIHSTTQEPDVPLSRWKDDQKFARGAQQCRWDYQLLCDAGFAVITCSRYDFYPDTILGRKESVFRLFHDEEELKPTNRQYTAISAWAYGYSILRELAATFPEIDATQIWAHGHSRLGKTALWTVANDPAWAGGISNCSGCEGASLSRRRYGETLEVIDHFLSWWSTPACRPYAEDPATLPFDQHTLIALAAPRPILVTGAHEDRWADPRGEFLAVKAAQEAYGLLGLPTLPFQECPRTDELLMCPSLGFYERYGIHDVTDEDWKNTIRFIHQKR